VFLSWGMPKLRSIINNTGYATELKLYVTGTMMWPISTQFIEAVTAKRY